MEHGSLAGNAVDKDLATHQLHQAFTDRETEPGPTKLPRG